ncbi:hypothetical protein HYW32_00480 [Candidatus Berkelbacteria bacterium]|nr:hypothetical protein [Candidatus Berkelbacteria bacterium]
MPEKPSNFGERLQQIQSELTKTPEKQAPTAEATEKNVEQAEATGESPAALREKFLRYRQLQQETTGFSVEVEDITSQLAQGKQLLAEQASATEGPEKAAALQQLQELLREMLTELERLQTEQRSREQLLQELMTPAFERVLEQTARAETASRENIEQLRELLSQDAELHSIHRLELLGRLFGLEPSQDNKNALAEAIKTMVAEHHYYGSTGSEDAAGTAILKAIELSDVPPQVKDLIELIRPSADYLGKIGKQQAETVESLYTYRRDAVYKALADKNIRHTIAQGDPEAAERIFASELEELEQHRDKLHTSEISSYQHSIVDLYLKAGNVEGARKFVASEQFGGSRDYDAYVAIFKVSGDKADLENARSMRVHYSHYSQTEKWQKIGQVSGEQVDMDKANQALVEMSTQDHYPTDRVFSFYERMNALPGIDKTKLQEILRGKAKAMSQLDRAKAYITIAGMSKRPEDENALRAEIQETFNHEREFERGAKSVVFTGQEYIDDAASGYGYLLKDFLQYVSSDPGRLTPQNRQIAERLLSRYEQTYPMVKKESSRARTMFWGDINGAKERVASLFQTPEQFQAELGRSDLKTVYKKGWVKIQYYGSGGRVDADQKALEAVVDTLKQKCKDAKEFGNYLGDFIWRLTNQARTEQDFRFLQRIIESNRSEEVIPAYDNTMDFIHSQLAKFSARTHEADQHITELKDNYWKGSTIAEVAKLRRDLSRMGA